MIKIGILLFKMQVFKSENDTSQFTIQIALFKMNISPFPIEISLFILIY